MGSYYRGFGILARIFSFSCIDMPQQQVYHQKEKVNIRGSRFS